MARRSPQEKKLLSYAKDRRNGYAENDKTSRKAVRLHKRLPNRANRHRLHQSLQAATGSPDDDAAYEAEERLARRRPKKWRKDPDMPLGDWVESRLQRRLQLQEGSPANERRLAQVQKRRQRRTKYRTLRTASLATKGDIERRW
ncbi:hypothetical protein ACIBF1_07080 [Spirillospora sp. NPDC050679]